MRHEQLARKDALRKKVANLAGAAALVSAVVVAGCAEAHGCDPETTAPEVAEPGDTVDGFLYKHNDGFDSSAERYEAREAFYELNPNARENIQSLNEYEVPVCNTSE